MNLQAAKSCFHNLYAAAFTETIVSWQRTVLLIDCLQRFGHSLPREMKQHCQLLLPKEVGSPCFAEVLQSKDVLGPGVGASALSRENLLLKEEGSGCAAE